ncbi:hypothetical protein [Ruegeria atlantica]|uniref:hypothetical protein n=1 Tax=Ruegeria atlantica TaxID=81569 RepID=UPI001481C8D9|nr:hypothetical protein [Ruegeria atlantica]
MNEILIAIFGGLVGGVVSPILLEEYRARKHKKDWKEPRKMLLKSMLEDPKYRFKSIDKLSRTIGSTPDDTRTLLIELKARGAKMKKSKKEGWALIERAPLQEELRAIEQEEMEEDQPQ